ncbi:hypothetical protein [Halarcobacter ebronensis]|uniref:GGDEF domain-containing protein n=1 Tax=Halarcobacter ebronensis TaxID=1462615 RepID=A0A4Q1AM23_9BACT|nr:hypothetical protein [Halarcobacter ebronensis]QKF82680.1 hypothetical protein AEBR_2212 [Halarcobacter ebronensis]RXK06707.1 hypothetical protein CRV07_04570 [Halarcobacter ebronensis]
MFEILEDINSANLLPLDSDTLEVTNLIEKYDLKKDNTILNNIENNYLIVTKFISKLYLLNLELPEDLKSFIKTNHNYKIYLLNYIQQKMKIIISENSIFLFKEIFILMNLLSNGEKYYFLTKDNHIDLKELMRLLNSYENDVCEKFLRNNEQIFNISFHFYLTLLELLNEISIINSLDIQRRKNVIMILDSITSSISNIKNKVKLEDFQIVLLNAVLGKQLLYFTNISYTQIDTENRDAVISKYALMFKKIEDGYKLLSSNDKYYVIYLEKVSTLILTLIYKLKVKLHLKTILLKEENGLYEIYNLYNNSVKKSHTIECKSIDDFRDELLKNFRYIYAKNTNTILDESVNMLDYFINLKTISNVELIAIHNLVLYTDTIEKKKLDLLVGQLLNNCKYNNNYYEFYKLKIIDRVIQKYISLKVETQNNTIIDEIITYIENNNVMSHLMSMYGKIYLSLSLYYSYEINLLSQEKSKSFYFIYQNLDNDDFLEKEFNNISRQIVTNYAKNYCMTKFESNIDLTNDELYFMGSDFVNRYIEIENLKIKNEIYKSSQELIKEILAMNKEDDLWLFSELEKLISEKIFFKTVGSKIEDKSKKNTIEIGYDCESIELYNDYALNICYSSYYKKAFMKIFQENRDFIELISRNIFKSYINSIPSYSDIITKLPNINKLKNELRLLDSKKINFVEIYLDSLVEFSQSNNVKKSNEFFRAIAEQINKKDEAFRLFGPKIGIILNKKEGFKELVNYIKSIKITFENREYPIKSTIALSKGEAKTILDKSFFALSSAKISKSKFYIYE